MENDLENPEKMPEAEVSLRLAFLTISDCEENDRLAVAVPNTTKFKDLTSSWRNAPLIHKLQLGFLLVSRKGDVEGLDYLLQ